MGERLILALGAALLAAPSALAAGGPGSALTAPIEQAPLSWGGAAMASPAGPAAEEPLPIEAAASDAASTAVDWGFSTSPPPPPPPPSSSPGGRTADQVESLVVRAPSVRPQDQTVEKCVTGPAWWRVSNATTTLWIMATPDRAPMDTQFDDTCLRKRLAAARVLLIPAPAPIGALDPFSRGDTPLRAAATPIDHRISPTLWSQLSRRIDNNPIRAADERDWARLAPVQDLPPGLMRGLIPAGSDRSRDPTKPQMKAPSHVDAHSRMVLRSPQPGAPAALIEVWEYPGGPRPNLTASGGADWIDYTLYRYSPRTTLQVMRDTPNLYAPPVLVAQRLSRAFDLPGRIGNPAASRAASLAATQGLLVGRTEISAAQFSDMTYLSDPAAADQEACLKKVLDALDAGRTGLGALEQVQAWAVGDQTSALRRMNVLSTCSFGDLSVRFWSSVVAQEMQLIDRIFSAGGVGVALVEYDPLFMRGGVMERLKAAGYRIETPEDLR